MKTQHKEHSMRRFSFKVAALVAVLALWAGTVAAQTTLTNTTLAAAITNASDQVMTITSATGWTASTSAGQTFALIDREVVGVRSLSSTQVGIIRGLFSTRATGHASGAKVWFIPIGSVALSSSDRAGACSTAGNADLSQSGSVVPVLNPSTGNAFYCLGSVWVPVTHLLGTNFCTVTQATSKSTGVTCAGMGGTITMNAAGLATVTTVSFTVTDTAVAAGDTIMVALKSGNTASAYQATVDAVAAGSFVVSLRNNTGGTLSEAVVLNFAVLKVS
jgi:hypothetical protein